MWRDMIGWFAALAFASTPPTGSSMVGPAQGVWPEVQEEVALQSSTLRPMLTFDTRYRMVPDADLIIPNLPQGVRAIHQSNAELLRGGLEEAGEAFIQQNFKGGFMKREAKKQFERHFDQMVEFIQTHTEQVAFRAQDKTLSVWMRMESGALRRVDIAVDRRFLRRTANLKLWCDDNQDGVFGPKENIDLSHLKLDNMF